MRRPAALLLLRAAILGVAACDDAFVDPFLRDAAPYSLYGLVTADVTPRIQRVRVQRVRALADPPASAQDPAAEVDGRVESVDPSTGGLVRWTPREVVFEDGSVGMVFEQAFQVPPASRLGVVFTDATGREARAEAVIPPAPAATVQPPVGNTAGGPATQRIRWEGARFLPEALVQYSGVDSLGQSHHLTKTYPIVEGGGGAVDLPLALDLALLAAQTDIGPDGLVRELIVRMTVTALADALPPADVIPTGDTGRAFVAGAAVGRVVWSPEVAPAEPEPRTAGGGRRGRL